MLENLKHLVLTVTRDCNLNCTYCFEENKQLYRGEKMTPECFAKFLDCFVRDQAKTTVKHPEPLEICFHGGEPLLAGIPLLQSFIDLARQKLNNVSFGLQTNGTLLDAGWQEFAAKNNVSPSISLDGLDYRANKFRFVNSHSFRQANPLRKKLNIAGVLALLTKNNVTKMPAYMLYLFCKYKISTIRANVAEFVNADADCTKELTGKQLVEKFYIPVLRLISFFPKICEHHIQFFLDKFVISYLYTPGAETPDLPRFICEAKFCGAGNTIINLLPDGTLWACQRSLGLPSYRMGNIYEETPDIFGIFSFNKLFALGCQMAKSVRAKGCDTCFAADICNYGCRAFGLLKTGGASTIREDQACDVYKYLKKYLFRDVYNHIILYALLHRLPVCCEKRQVKIAFSPFAGTDFALTRIRDRNIQVFPENGQIWLTIPRNKINRRNLFWLRRTK